MKSIRVGVPAIDGYEVEYYFSDSSKVQPPRVFPYHLHDQLELYVLLEGDVSFVVESSLYKLSPGDAIIAKPNEMHNCILNTSSVHRHLCLWFDTQSEFLFQHFLSHSFGKDNLIVPSDEAKGELFHLCEQLRATPEEDTHRQFYLTLHLLDIFRRFLTSEPQAQQMPEVLKSILLDIEESFATIGSGKYFTSKYYISQSTLNRLFRTYLHTTPRRYIEVKRLAHSCVLLKKGSSVQEACMESGFSDYSNYIRLFKRCFHVTPSKYRSGK